jgi:N-methylhydantoinase A
MKLSDFDGELIKSLLTDLKTEAVGFVRNCDAEAEILSDYKVYMRYTGQGWEIPISLTQEQATNPDAKTFQDLFEKDYTNLFGRPVHGMDVEITVWAVNATTRPEPVDRVHEERMGDAAPKQGARAIFDPAIGAQVDAAIVLRDDMNSGMTVEGPAAITEDETTIIVPSSRRAIRQPDGCIDLSIKA